MGEEAKEEISKTDTTLQVKGFTPLVILVLFEYLIYITMNSFKINPVNIFLSGPKKGINI